MSGQDADAAPRGLIYRAIPGDGWAGIKLWPDGTPRLVWPNIAIFPTALRTELARGSDVFWHGPGRVPRLDGVPWVVNMCADPDAYLEAMQALERAIALEQTLAARRVPVFNEPSEIWKTRRDRIARTLDGIPGLTVPRCVRFAATRIEDFARVFAENGFAYPVLVRPAGTQTGAGLVRIDGPESWDRAATIPWGGRMLYMTQFVDFRGPDGDYAKIRVAIAGGVASVRHVHFADAWPVHNAPPTPEKTARENALIDLLEADPQLRSVVAAIMRAVRLDFWGVDLGYAGPGRDLVFFEGNAAMSMLFDRRAPRPGEPAVPDELRAKKRRIADDLLERLTLDLAQPMVWASRR